MGILQEPRKLGEFADIIDYEWHGTTTHTPMSMEKRASQFSPFAALTGMGDKLDEEIRYTQEQGADHAEISDIGR